MQTQTEAAAILRRIRAYVSHGATYEAALSIEEAAAHGEPCPFCGGEGSVPTRGGVASLGDWIVCICRQIEAE